jgi:hypothetical protein
MSCTVPTVDAEFARLIPPLAKEERHRLEVGLLADGCCDALLVWQEQNVLLDGHNRLELCQAHNIPFACKLISLPDRDAARAYIVGLQLGRRNLTREAASYLRGKRYQAEKLPVGHPSGAGQICQSDRINTAQRLAAEYKVGERTIYRDEQFAHAVDALVAHCGDDARHLVLSRDSGLTRAQVLALARRAPAEQKEALQALAKEGKLPRRPQARPRASMTLPREPQALVAKLVERLGLAGAAEVFRLLALYPGLSCQRQGEAGGDGAGPATTMVGPEANVEPLGVVPTGAGLPQAGASPGGDAPASVSGPAPSAGTPG